MKNWDKYQLPRHFLLRRHWKITQRTRNVSFNIYHSREDKQCRVSQCRMMHAMYLRNILVASGVEYHSSVVTGLILFYFGSQIFLADSVTICNHNHFNTACFILTSYYKCNPTILTLTFSVISANEPPVILKCACATCVSLSCVARD